MTSGLWSPSWNGGQQYQPEEFAVACPACEGDGGEQSGESFLEFKLGGARMRAHGCWDADGKRLLCGIIRGRPIVSVVSGRGSQRGGGRPWRNQQHRIRAWA
eukprot:3993252-Pyramimonas_sp.AAC.1